MIFVCKLLYIVSLLYKVLGQRPTQKLISTRKSVKFQFSIFSHFYVAFSSLVALMLSGPMVAFELQAPEAIYKWLELVGPEDPEMALATAPHSLRAFFGENVTYNAIHGSACAADFHRVRILCGLILEGCQ